MMDIQSTPDFALQSGPNPYPPRHQHGVRDGVIEMRSRADKGFHNSNCPVDDRIQRIDEIRIQLEAAKLQERQLSRLAPEPNRMVGFFLTVFVFGQVISAWAFVASHVAAWICGIGFSAFGLTVVLTSLAMQMESHRKEISCIKMALEKQTQTPDPSRSTASRFSPAVANNEKVIA